MNKDVLMTLCILRDNDKVLLAMKKRGFGKGKWNGYGGKLESNENLEQALIRELKEESTVDLLEYEKRGDIKFHFPDMIRHVHIYEVIRWIGEPKETEEMSPKWFLINDIPFQQMWPSDKGWFQYFLYRIPFSGSASFDTNNNVLSLNIKKV